MRPSPGNGAASRLGGRAATIVGAALLLAAVTALVAQTVAVAFPSWNDENVHLYVAGRVAQGAVLYRDIHSARPPLAILPLAAALRAGLPPHAAARGLVLLAHLLTGLVLLLAGRRLWGTISGIAAAFLYFTAGHVLARSSYTAIQLVALAALTCVVLALLERPACAGLAGGLALVTGQHAAVLVGLSFILAARAGWRSAVRFAAAAALASGAVLGLALGLGGYGLFQDLIGTHLYHLTGGEGATSDVGWWIGLFSLEDALVLALAALAALRISAGRWLTPARLLVAMALVHVLVVALMKGGLALYLFPVLPVLALAAGQGASQMLEMVLGSASLARRAAVAVGAGAIVIAGWWGASAMLERRDGLHYPVEPHLRQTAMERLQRLVAAERIAPLARALPPGETVFGFPTLIAEVALQSDRRVAGELADLAPRWLQTGSVTSQSIIEAIEQDRVALIASPSIGVVRDSEFQGYLKRCYEAPRVFPRPAGDGSGIPSVFVWRRSDAARPCR